MPQIPHIRILMCTHNGARHIAEQLDSFLAQSHTNWSLWVSDDGSTDATPEILARFRNANANRDIRILRGPGQGGTHNFLTLLTRPDPAPGLVALSDQDDVWMPEKLARAARAMAGQPPEVPTAYGAGWYVTDDKLRIRRRSRIPRRGPSFSNALVQNILSGHSLVLNETARALLAAAGQPNRVAFQDWWIYLLITGTGGRVILDDAPVLYYRQHRHNMFGANTGLRALYRRLRLLAGSGYWHWVHGNAHSLTGLTDRLTPENLYLLERFLQTEGARGLARMQTLRQLGVHRQSGVETLALMLAAMLGSVVATK